MVTDWPDDVIEDGLDIAAANLAAAVHALVDAACRNQPGLEVEVPSIDPDHLDTSIWRLITFRGLGPSTPPPCCAHRSDRPGARSCTIIDERRSCSTPSATTTGRLIFATTDRDGMAEKRGRRPPRPDQEYARQETTEPLKGAGR